jgi:hypothetical protein
MLNVQLQAMHTLVTQHKLEVQKISKKKRKIKILVALTGIYLHYAIVIKVYYYIF